MSLRDRAIFAAALWDVATNDPTRTTLGDHEAWAFGDAMGAIDAVVLLSASTSAHALVRAAPPLDDLPDVVTPWIRARAWATAHRDAPLAPPVSARALDALVALAAERGLTLVDPAAVAAFVTQGSLARAFVFAKRRGKLRLDRVQDAVVRANGVDLRVHDAAIEGAAFSALAAHGREPIAFKEVLRRARASAGASSDDGKKLATAFVRAWERSDIELGRR